MKRFLSQGRPDDIGVNLIQFQGQRSDTDEGGQLFCLVNAAHARDLRGSAGDLLLNRRRADHLSVIDYGDCLSHVSCRGLLELFCPVGSHGQLYHIFMRAGLLIIVGNSLRVRDVGSFQHHISVRVLKLKRTGLSQILKDFIGVRHTGNFYVDTVQPLLIDICLRTVLLHTLLQFVDRVVHILLAGIGIRGLVGDADTSGKIQSGPDVFHGTRVLAPPPCDDSVPQKDRHHEHDKENRNALFFLHHRSLVLVTFFQFFRGKTAFLIIAFQRLFVQMGMPAGIHSHSAQVSQLSAVNSGCSFARAALIISAHSTLFLCITQPI